MDGSKRAPDLRQLLSDATTSQGGVAEWAWLGLLCLAGGNVKYSKDP